MLSMIFLTFHLHQNHVENIKYRTVQDCRILSKRFRWYLNISICNKFPGNSDTYLNLRTTDLKCLQAYLGDTVGLVSDHHNKANISINKSQEFFWFSSAYKSYVYTVLQSIKCAIAFCLKQ